MKDGENDTESVEHSTLIVETVTTPEGVITGAAESADEPTLRDILERMTAQDERLAAIEQRLSETEPRRTETPGETDGDEGVDGSEGESASETDGTDGEPEREPDRPPAPRHPWFRRVGGDR